MAQNFRTTLWAGGGNNVGIVVPESVVTSLDHGKRVPVVVTVDDDHTFRSSIVSMGGQFLISFNAATRAATGRGAGDEVEVTVEVDDQPRTIEPPPELAAALADDETASRAWSALSYSNQRRHAEAVAGAKTDATRERRIAAVLQALHV